MTKFYNFITFPIICLLFISCASTKNKNFHLVSYGIGSIDNQKWGKTEEGNFEKMHLSPFFEVTETTDNIPAKIGTTFGFKYKIIGNPKNKIITVQHLGIHPKLTNPHNGRTFDNYMYIVKTKIGKTSYIGYKFDENWELVPGKWTFQVVYEDKVMVEKEFNVYKK